MGIFKDLTGQTFSRLTVLRFVGMNHNHKSIFECRCECGTVKTYIGAQLSNGNSNSCGCYGKARRKEGTTKHGFCGTPEYTIWKSMKGRCYKVNDKFYYAYGARGIKVCDQWLNNPAQFMADMGKRPTKHHSIDRIDNDKGYSPENCRWATPKQQARNTTRSHFINTQYGRITVAEASEKTGIAAGAIHQRIKMGWSEPYLLTPSNKSTRQLLSRVINNPF